jgi:hypothetical protein
MRRQQSEIRPPLVQLPQRDCNSRTVMLLTLSLCASAIVTVRTDKSIFASAFIQRSKRGMSRSSGPPIQSAPGIIRTPRLAAISWQISCKSPRQKICAPGSSACCAGNACHHFSSTAARSSTKAIPCLALTQRGKVRRNVRVRSFIDRRIHLARASFTSLSGALWPHTVMVK